MESKGSTKGWWAQVVLSVGGAGMRVVRRCIAQRPETWPRTRLPHWSHEDDCSLRHTRTRNQDPVADCG
jgi:hypothetical protein